MPELTVDPGDPGDEAVGLYGAKYRSRPGIDLVDLPVPMLPDPQRPFGPGEPGATAAGRRDRGDHMASLRIDLLDAIPGELKEVLPIKSSSCIRSDVDRAHDFPAYGIEGLQRVSATKPDVLTVIRDSMHVLDTRKRPVLTDDLGR